eukprot:XP_001710314.1 Hypothetical protein GL50803_28385 [Giardia lamblia ATCC 50803]
MLTVLYTGNAEAAHSMGHKNTMTSESMYVPNEYDGKISRRTECRILK